MTLRRKRLLIAIIVVVVAVLAAAATARAVFPGWLRATIERLVSEAIGRELKIAGSFDLSLSLTPRLVAGDITLANAPSASDPFMIKAQRLAVAVELRSLWSGPVRIKDVQLDGAEVVLERNGDGRANWAFDRKPAQKPPAGPPARPPFAIEHAAIRGLSLVYRGGGGARPLNFRITDLNAGTDPETGRINVRGSGDFNDAPWDVAGWLGSFDNVVAARDVDQAVTGHIADSALSLRGRFRHPLTLRGPNVEVTIDGPDVAAAMAVLGLKTRLSGRYQVHGVLTPVDDDIGIDADAAVGDLKVSARGKLGAILDPSRIDLTVTAAGPDAAFVGDWLGVDHLPRRSFDLVGRVRRDGKSVTCEGVKLRVGETSLVVNGALGATARAVGTDLRVTATGSDFAELSALTRLRLPTGPFAVSGRFLRKPDAMAIEDVNVKVQGTSIRATGTIGEPPRLENLDLTVDGSGPDASWLSGITRVQLPEEPFEVRGRVRRSGSAIALDGVGGRLGAAQFEVTGRLAPVRGLAGSEGTVHLAGDDLAKTASIAGMHKVPAEPFRFDGHVVVASAGITFDDVEAQVGSVVAEVDGYLGAPSIANGTSLACRVRGPELSALAAWGIGAKLPSDPFTVAGTLRIDDGVYRLGGVTGEIGANRLAIDGVLGALPENSTLDVDVEASEPSLAGVLRSFTAANAERWEKIASESYSVSGRVTRVPNGVVLHDAKAKVGAASVYVSGTVMTGARVVGTDLSLDVEAPGTATLSQLIGITLPDQPIHARGRIVRVDNGLQLDGVSVTLGPSYAEFSGTLGEPPNFEHTELEASVLGPDLSAVLGPMTGLAPLPRDSFEVSAHVAASRERIDAKQVTARLANNDVEGSLSVIFGAKPVFDADLRSKHIGVARLIAGFSPPEDAAEDASAPKPKPRGKKDRLISDQPLSLGALRAVDGRLRLSAAAVTFTGLPLHDVAIEGDLRDGVVTIGRFEGTGANGGKATASLSLAPKDNGFSVRTAGRVEGARLAFMKTGDAPASAPSLDLEYDLRGTGRSLHELAASANGWALLMMGPGQVPNTFGGFVTSDVLIALMDALNPFRKSSPYTKVECGVAAAGIEAGKTVVQPIAVRSDKLTVLGTGKVDFNTEAISLVWTLKPRRGIGLSAGSISNPYIKLDGTLASPTLDLKPLEAVVSTGAAVATAGLTLLFRGIYDRITAEKKVCDDALLKARKRIDAKATSPED